MNVLDSSVFSQSKKDIAGIILLKKGFLHRKLQQNKKCEEAFQRARNMSDSSGIKIIAFYQLILLYISNKYSIFYKEMLEVFNLLSYAHYFQF